MNAFFKNGNKLYSENLNDSVLVSNVFEWTLTIDLPTDTGNVFPNSDSVVKAKVADVSITPNSNLSIGSSIENNSGASQIYRLTLYPNFNRYGGFKSITVDGDGSFYIANKGSSTPIVNNLNYSNLSNVPELKVLKEYDIIITIPTGGEVENLSFVLQSNGSDASCAISQDDIVGLYPSLSSKVNVSDIKDNLTSVDINKPLSANQGKVLQDNKVDKIEGKVLSTNDFTNKYKTNFGKNGWTTIKTRSQDGILYINPLLRLVDFRFYRTEAYIENEETFLDVCIAGVGESIAPKMETPLSSYNVKIKGKAIRSSNGYLEIYGFVDSEEITPRTINLRGMWHY